MTAPSRPVLTDPPALVLRVAPRRVLMGVLQEDTEDTVVLATREYAVTDQSLLVAAKISSVETERSRSALKTSAECWFQHRSPAQQDLHRMEEAIITRLEILWLRIDLF